MKELVDLAKNTYDRNPDLARRYIEIVLKYRDSNRVRIPKEIKNSFCKKCHTPWIPGKTVKVRLTNKLITYTCLVCGYKKRIPYAKTLKKE